MNDQKTFYPLVGVEKEVHLIDYLNVVFRRWKIVLFIMLVVFCVVSLRTLLMQPIYEAAATLEVGGKKQQGLLEGIDVGGDGSVETEIEKLRSRSLAETAIKQLNLHWQIGAFSKGLDFTVREFSVQNKLPGLLIELTGPETFRVSDLSGTVLCEAHNHKLCDFNGGQILVDIDNGQAGQFLEFEQVSTDELVESFMDKLSVGEVGKMTNVIRVSFRDTDPDKARDVVNLLIDGYLSKNVSSRTQEAGKAVDFISQQLDGVRSKLDFSEQRLQEYKVQTGLITLGPEGSSLVEKMVSLEQEQAELNLKRQRVDFAISSLRQAVKQNQTFSPPTIEDFPQIAEAANQLAELEAQKNGLLVDYTRAHPQVVEIQAQIQQVQEAMLSNYKSVRQELLLRERDIAQTISGFEGQLEDIPEAELELAKRLRVNEVNSGLYTFLLQKQQEAQIAQASTISDASVIDPALTPRRPVAPNKRKNLALGLILGIMLGVGMAFLLDYMDQTLKTTEDIREKLNLNVFGIIPRIPFADEDAKLPGKRLVTTLSPKSPVVEAFRALRTNLNFATGKEKHKLIMITSSLPNEGKSTVSGNLAVVMAQTGAKVLLVGCDLRRPSLYQMFDQKSEPGLVNLLLDNNQDALHRNIKGTNLDFLSAGTVPPNPSEILDSNRFKKFLEIARQRYDYVLIDATPVLPVTDAQIIAPLVDINLVVLEPCRVPEKAALQMVETLRAVNAKITGIIFNDKSGRGFKYYGSYNYYGDKYYRGYYGEDDAELKDGAFVAAIKRAWGRLNS